MVSESAQDWYMPTMTNASAMKEKAQIARSVLPMLIHLTFKNSGGSDEQYDHQDHKRYRKLVVGRQQL